MNDPHLTGSAEASVTAVAGRIAIAGRTVVVVAVTALLLPGAETPTRFAAVALLWTIAFVVLRNAVLDTVVLAALCLLVAHLQPAHGYLDLDDWTRQVTSVVVVTTQWHTRPRIGLPAVVVVAAAVAAGPSLADPTWNVGLTHAVMLLWQGALSRLLAVIVTRGARQVDEQAGAVAAGRHAAHLAAARRADVEHHLAAVHDTVAATLTAAASRGAAGPGLPRRARADLDSLAAQHLLGGEPGDLTEPPTGTTLDVTVVQHGPLPPPLPLEARRALLAARDEALRNVERHAGTGRARLELRALPGDGIEVAVVDEGRGFPAGAAGSRFGVRLSIEARMRHAGGSATVVSAPGQGTRVELRWPGPA